MARIFVLANSYTVNNIVGSLNYVLNISIEEILLLKENHRSSDFNFINNLNIRLYENIDNCIEDCNFVLIIQDNNIPTKTINYIVEKCAIKNIKCISINNPWRRKYVLPLFDSIDENYKLKPMLLNICIGESAQPYRVEILLNAIFKEKNIRIKQFFSKQTELYLWQLKNSSILANDILDRMNNCDKDCDILVCTVCIDENLELLKEALQQIKQFFPDFIILQTNANYSLYGEVHNIIEYNLFTKIDFKICSNYYNYDNLYNIYCKDLLFGEDFENIESAELRPKIEERFFEKISFPSNVIPL